MNERDNEIYIASIELGQIAFNKAMEELNKKKMPLTKQEVCTLFGTISATFMFLIVEEIHRIDGKAFSKIVHEIVAALRPAMMDGAYDPKSPSVH